MSLSFDDRTITVDGSEHRILVAVPTERIVVGRDRLELLRKGIEPSPVDLALIRSIEAMGELSAFVFQGQGEGDACWRLDEDLTDRECGELGTLLVESHLPVRRALVEAGALDHIYIGWDERSIRTFEIGLDRLRERVDGQAREAAKAGTSSAGVRLDLWVLDRNAFYSSLTLDDVVADLLPTRFRTRASRLQRYAQLKAEVDR